MVLDEAEDRVLLFGGSGYEPQLRPLDDLWAFDLEWRAWSLLTPAGDVPTGGGSRRAAVVPSRREAYLFGGYDERQQPNYELYRMSFGTDPVTFTRIEQENAPPERLLHAFVYDPGHDRFVLHAGVGTGGFYDDTWIMTVTGDRAVWTRLDLAERPSPRYGSAYACRDLHGLGE